jgi:hypothetical protein
MRVDKMTGLKQCIRADMTQPTGTKVSTVKPCSADRDIMTAEEYCLMGYVGVQSEVHRCFVGIY